MFPQESDKKIELDNLVHNVRFQMKQKANFLLVLTLLTEWCKCWGIVDDVASATKVCLALFWSDWPIACHVINMPSPGLLSIR